MTETKKEKGVMGQAVEALLESEDCIVITKKGLDIKFFEMGEDVNLTATLAATMLQSENFKTRVDLASREFKKQIDKERS